MVAGPELGRRQNSPAGSQGGWQGIQEVTASKNSGQVPKWGEVSFVCEPPALSRDANSSPGSRYRRPPQGPSRPGRNKRAGRQIGCIGPSSRPIQQGMHADIAAAEPHPDGMAPVWAFDARLVEGPNGPFGGLDRRLVPAFGQRRKTSGPRAPPWSTSLPAHLPILLHLFRYHSGRRVGEGWRSEAKFLRLPSAPRVGEAKRRSA
jgi:hypothetical protein